MRATRPFSTTSPSDQSPSLSILSAAFLAYHVPASTAYDRPIHTVVLALTACAFLLPSASRALPHLLHIPDVRLRKGEYTALALEELGDGNGRLDDISTKSSEQARQNRKVRVTVLSLAVFALSVRIELYRRISQASECTIQNVEVFLPFLLAAYDASRSQRSLELQQEDRPDISMYEWIQATIRTYILKQRIRYMIPAFTVSYGCYLALGLWTSSSSTYICPIALKETRAIPAMQIGALILDFCLIAIAYETTPKPDGSGLPARRCVVLWSSVMMGTSVVWYIVAAAFYTFRPQIRYWLLFLSPATEFGTILAIGAHVFVFCVLCISLLRCVRNTHPRASTESC